MNNKEIKKTLLIADDSTLVISNLKRLLAGINNIEIYESNDVESTKKNLDLLSPAILILDIKMPGGSGYDILEYLQAREIKPLILVLTNFSDEISQNKCLNLGADYYLDKSKEHKQAVEIIKEVMRDSDG